MKTKKQRMMGLLAALTMTATLFAACAPVEQPNNTKPEEPRVTVRAAALKGPTGMGMADLMEKQEKKETKDDYVFTLAGAPEEITAKLIAGELDVASVPTNLAATLYQKTNGEIMIAANNTLGVLSVLSADKTVKSIADLKGKTIYASGKGSTAEYVLNYILEKNGLKVNEDVTVEYKAEHSELAAAAIAGNADIVVLPEPFVTNVKMKTERMENQIDLSDEWAKVSGGSPLVMGSIVVRKSFAEQNKKAVENFLNEYEKSVKMVNETPKDAAVLIEKFGIMPAAVAEKAIPSCNIVFEDGDSMKTATEQFLQIMFEANAKSVGGQLPGADFYYQEG